MKNLNLEEKERIICLFTKVKDPNIGAIIINTVPLDVLLEIFLMDLKNISNYEKNRAIPEIVSKRFENDKNFVKDNCDKLIKTKYRSTRLLAIPYISLNALIEIAQKERDDIIAIEIFTRLISSQDNDIVKSNANKLINADNPRIREFAVAIAHIEDVMTLAVNETNGSVATIIVKRLESEENSDFLNENYYKLAKAKSREIRNLYLRKLSIKELIEHVLNSYYILDNQLITLLKDKKNEEELKKYIHKLVKAKDPKIRQLIVESLISLSEVIEMAVNEDDYDVVGEIILRFNLEKDTDAFKYECYKLAKAKNYEIRRFAANVVPIDVLFEMALEEQQCYIVDAILHRLSLHENDDFLKKNGYKLSIANDCSIRLFSLKYLSIKELFNLAIAEDNIFAEDKIIKMLKEEEGKNLDIIKANCYRLLKANMMGIRLYATNFLSLEDVDSIPAKKCDKAIVHRIMDILN